MLGNATRLCLALVCAGCTFAPSVTVPPKELKEAATELKTGTKEAGKEIAVGLDQAGEKVAERYEDEIRGVSQDLHAVTQAVRDLVDTAKGSPAVLGSAFAQQLLQEEAVKAALKEVSVLARTQERLTEAGTDVPKILAAKLSELQRDLGNKEGFLSQQRAALMEDVKRERQAITDAVRQERNELFKDLDALAVKVVERAGEQVRKAVETALGLVIVLALVVLGVPFTAGFLAGRYSKKP